jgi:hypothetical protein
MGGNTAAQIGWQGFMDALWRVELQAIHDLDELTALDVVSDTQVVHLLGAD